MHAINFWILQNFCFFLYSWGFFVAKLTLYVFHSNLNLCSLLVTNQYDCISLSFPSLSDPNKLGCNHRSVDRWVLGHIYDMKNQFPAGFGSLASTEKKLGSIMSNFWGCSLELVHLWNYVTLVFLHLFIGKELIRFFLKLL